MTRKGRFLEIVSRQLHEFLGPQGLEIKSPEIFRNDKGELIGEVDVTIRGSIGASRIFIGVECRDRPGDGPQGLPWIREIVGKQDQLKIDRMVAVSSTGFNEHAIAFASEKRIDLISIENVDGVDVRGWCRAVEFQWEEGRFEIFGRVDIKTEPALVDEDSAFDQNVPFIFDQADPKKTMTLLEYVKPEAMRLLDGGKYFEPANFQLRVAKGGMLFVKGEPCSVKQVTVGVKVWHEVQHSVAVLTMCTDPKTRESIAMTGVCRIELPAWKGRALLVFKRSVRDPGKYELQVSLHNPDGSPREMQPGSTVTLYGSQASSAKISKN
jgi:hypothetical protein